MFSLQELLLFIISGKNNVLLGCGQNRRRPCLFRKAQIREIRGQSNIAQWKEWSVIICSLSSEALSSPQWFASGNSAQFCKLTAGRIREISLACRQHRNCISLSCTEHASFTQYHLVANGPGPEALKHVLWYLTLGLRFVMSRLLSVYSNFNRLWWFPCRNTGCIWFGRRVCQGLFWPKITRVCTGNLEISLISLEFSCRP